MTRSDNYYEILGVPSTADEETLHTAFRKLSKILHPDTTTLPKEEASEKFHKVCEAYEMLHDPLSRKDYDLNIFGTGTGRAIVSSSFKIDQSYKHNNHSVGMRRPLSGGELFSLFLLIITLLVCLFLGFGFALLQGRELQSLPGWLILENKIAIFIPSQYINGLIAFASNSLESTFFS